MGEDFPQSSKTLERAIRPSIIQSFAIERLYGYRNISLESDYSATILIARNGSGKTTLLGALDAFLRMQFTRLRELPFEAIVCKIRDHPEPLVLTHDDLVLFLQVPNDADLLKTATRCGMHPDTLFNYLVNDYATLSREDRQQDDDKISTSLRTGFNYSYREMESTLERIRANLYLRQEGVARIWQVLSHVLAETEIVYLPTYRRIELSLTDEPTKGPYARRQRPKFNVALGSLHTGDIQFGLADISDRLALLNTRIVTASNNGYREISANIINDLIDGSFASQEIQDSDIPSKDELELFFSRLKNRRVGPYPSVVAPNLEKLYSLDQVPAASAQFLPYFLAQLGRVIDKAKEVEAPVDDFVENCNKYLMSEDRSTNISDTSARHLGHDGKRLCLNRRNLAVHVESSAAGRHIALNALSSGEKQMVSLFAKMFLYPKRKIVLIDEPELSLSIDWQSQILVDVLNADACEQVIAITHSPFVFENDLDPFAQPLTITDTEDYTAEDFEDLFGVDFDDAE